MSIEIQVLGQAGEDNATLIRIDSGSSIERLLFDCGEKCIYDLGHSESQSIDHVFFSHFHMDHICGFDSYFRRNYNRPDKPVTLWGPPGTIELVHHRMRGFTWNLHHNQPGEWVVNEVDETGEVTTAVFYTRDAFETHGSKASWPPAEAIISETNYTVTAKFLSHGSIPSLAWRIDEPIRENIDPEKLSDLGIKPGPWLRELKETQDSTIEIDAKEWSVAELKDRLMVESPGQSAAYLTDFILAPDSEEWQEVTGWLSGVDTLVCEAQYCEADYELAEANFHMTTRRVGQLARDCSAGRLLIQHVSRRYDIEEWREMLAEAQEVFAETTYPDHWKL